LSGSEKQQQTNKPQRERERERREKELEIDAFPIQAFFGNAELGTDATHYRDAIPWILQSFRFAIFR
jgi:hypothetical protein